MECQICYVCKLDRIWRVEGTMDAQDYPLNVGIASGFFKILFKVVELLTAQLIGVLWGEVHHMNLSVIKRKPKISLIRGVSRKVIPFHIRSIVIVPLVIAYPRHERGVGCKFLSQLSKQVPNRLCFASFLRIHACICYVSCQKYKIQRLHEIVLGNLTGNEMSKRSEGTHVPKDSDGDLFQLLHFQRGRLEIFDVGKCSGFIISNFVIVAFERFQVLDNSPIYPSMETYVSHIISIKGCWNFLFELTWVMSIIDNRLIVLFRSRDPHYLHLPVDVSQSNMDLLMTWFDGDLYLGHFYEFLETDF